MSKYFYLNNSISDAIPIDTSILINTSMPILAKAELF